MDHRAIDDALLVLVVGFCDNLWRPLKYDAKSCHTSADLAVWLLAHEFGFAYAATGLFAPANSSLRPRDVAQRLAFATSRRAPSLREPVAMGVVSLVCTTRRDFHSIAFVVHGGDVMVLQADRNRYSLHDWADADGGRLPPYMRAAHRAYGGLRWVPAARFLADVEQGEFEPLCGWRCPRVQRLVLLVHERVLGTRATRGFDDAFVHGERVRLLLPSVATAVGRRVMQFMQGGSGG